MFPGLIESYAILLIIFSASFGLAHSNRFFSVVLAKSDQTITYRSHVKGNNHN